VSDRKVMYLAIIEWTPSDYMVLSVHETFGGCRRALREWEFIPSDKQDFCRDTVYVRDGGSPDGYPRGRVEEVLVKL